MSEFSGYLKEKELSAVLMDLWNEKSTGWLSVVTDKLDLGNIYLRDGLIIYSNIANQQERTGDILIRQGYITEDQLERAIRTQQNNSGRLLGSILVDLGFISNDELIEVLRDQITETVFTLLNWDNGYFNFASDRAPDDTYISVPIDTEEIIRDGAKRKELWNKIRNVLPNNEVIPFQNDEKAREFDLMTLSLIEEQIFYAIDGTKSVKQIIGGIGMSEFQVLEILLGLYNLGLVKFYDVERDRKKKVTEQISQLLDDGVTKIQAGLYNEAKNLFKNALELDHQHLEVRFYHGLCSLMTGDFEASEESFRHARDLESKKYAITNNLAISLEKLNREQDEIVKMWSRCIKINADDPKPYVNLALFLYHVKNYFLAQDQFRQALKLDPTNAAILFYLGVIACRENEIEQAVEFLDKAVRANPNIGQFRNNLGWALQRQGNQEEAKMEYQYALQINSNDWRTHLNLGELYLQQSLLEEAEKSFNKALESQPNSPYILFKLGSIAVFRRDPQKALELWEKAHSYAPNNTALAQAIDELKDLEE